MISDKNLQPKIHCLVLSREWTSIGDYPERHNLRKGSESESERDRERDREKVCLVLSREWGNGLWGLFLGILKGLL